MFYEPRSNYIGLWSPTRYSDEHPSNWSDRNVGRVRTDSELAAASARFQAVMARNDNSNNTDNNPDNSKAKKKMKSNSNSNDKNQKKKTLCC